MARKTTAEELAAYLKTMSVFMVHVAYPSFETRVYPVIAPTRVKAIEIMEAIYPGSVITVTEQYSKIHT